MVIEKGIEKVLAIPQIFAFFKMNENNKTLRECYKDHFTKNFKPEVNQHL